MEPTGTNLPCGLTILPLPSETVKDTLFSIHLKKSCQLSAISSQLKTKNDRFLFYEKRKTQNEKRSLKVSGGHAAGVTPDPIPNSVVKPCRADDTTRATAWESRTPPDLFS